MDVGNALAGLLLGTAVGDSVGLPYEALPPRRAQRLLGAPPYSQRLIFGRGAVSDDTDLSCMLVQSVLSKGLEPDEVATDFSRRLRWWLLSLPPGIGLATLRSSLRLWAGWPAARSGVRSAGNGAAMRSAALGVLCAHDTKLLVRMIRATASVTHRDERAMDGALAIALAARSAVMNRAGAWTHAAVEDLRQLVPDSALLAPVRLAVDAATAGDSADALIGRLGASPDRGVGGFVMHSVPFAMYCAARFSEDFRGGVEAAINAGGDTDTNAAMVGAILGAAHGPEAIPHNWTTHLIDRPRSIEWLRRLAERGALLDQHGTPPGPLPLPWAWYGVRTPLLMGVVLGHGFRRLAPPY